MKVLVTAATGNVATHSIPLLGKAGHEVVALVRTQDKAARLSEQGATALLGDLRDPASLRTALTGVDTLFLATPPHPDAAQFASGAITAAKEVGVRRVVRLSAIKAAENGPTDNTRQHARTETELARSGLAFTILRPHFFMQNFLSSVPSIQSEDAIYLATGEARLGMIDVRDIADVAARVIADADLDGATHELTGPETISLPEVARCVSRLVGRVVRYIAISPEALEESALRAGLGEWAAATFRDYNRAYGSGWGDFTTPSVEKLAGHRPRSFADFAAEVLGPALGNSDRGAACSISRQE